VFLIGRLTRDPEIRFLPSGNQVTSFTLAVNRRYRTKNSEEWKEETYYFDVEAFSYLAERPVKRGLRLKLLLRRLISFQDRKKQKS